jgi:hypothetical protein
MKKYWARYLCDINNFDEIEINDNRKVYLADEVDTEMEGLKNDVIHFYGEMKKADIEIAQLRKALEEIREDRSFSIINSFQKWLKILNIVDEALAPKEEK